MRCAAVACVEGHESSYHFAKLFSIFAFFDKDKNGYINFTEFIDTFTDRDDVGGTTAANSGFNYDEGAAYDVDSYSRTIRRVENQ